MEEQLRGIPSCPQIRAFLLALNLRHKDTAIHSALVSAIAVEIGMTMNIGDEQLVQLYAGALLHDIGKLAIPDAVLDKPAKLDYSERDIIRQHPVIGYNLLGERSSLDGARYIILNHHERYDGLGYPFGLSGNDIPFLARICSVADALAAMMIERPYRRKATIPSALTEIKMCTGKQFDPYVVETLSLINIEKLVISSTRSANDLWYS